MIQSQIVCSQQGHQKERIEFICLFKDCQDSNYRLYCNNCIQNGKHQSHHQQGVSMNQLLQNLDDKAEKEEKLTILQTQQQQTEILKQGLQNLLKSYLENKISQDNLNQQINQLILQEQNSSQLFQKQQINISQLNNNSQIQNNIFNSDMHQNLVFSANQQNIEIEEDQEKETKNTNNNNQNQDEQQQHATQQDTFQFQRTEDFISRYFGKYYKKYADQETQKNLDQYLFQHKNELCLIGLSPYHEIRQKQLKIEKISFDSIYPGDLMDFCSGKSNKKKISVGSHINIAKITCENGEIYKIKGIINGFLIEPNQNLVQNPNLILDQGDDKGYIAIIEVNKKKKKSIFDDKYLIKEEEYLNKEMGQQLQNFIDPKQ